MFRLVLFGIALVSLLSACDQPDPSTSKAPDRATKIKLSGPQIHKLYAGAIIRGKTTRGATYTLKHFPDGKAEVVWRKIGNSGSDKGTWRVKGNKSCKKWTTLRSGLENCVTIFKVGDNRYQAFSVDGELRVSEFSVVKAGTARQ